LKKGLNTLLTRGKRTIFEKIAYEIIIWQKTYQKILKYPKKEKKVT